MGKKCFIPNCKSGYNSNKEKVTMFSAPKNAETLCVWRRVIPRKDRLFSVKDCVCAKHFNEVDIIKEWTDGFNQIPLKHFKLKNGAFPTIFPPTFNNNGTEYPSESIIIKTEHDMQIDIEIPCSSTRSIFELLWHEEINIKYPSEFWSLNKISDSKSNYLSFVKLSLNKNQIPFVERQILLHKTMDLEVFVSDQRYEYNQFVKKIFAVDDINIILNHVNQLVICKGIRRSKKCLKIINTSKKLCSNCCNLILMHSHSKLRTQKKRNISLIHRLKLLKWVYANIKKDIENINAKLI